MRYVRYLTVHICRARSDKVRPRSQSLDVVAGQFANNGSSTSGAFSNSPTRASSTHPPSRRPLWPSIDSMRGYQHSPSRRSLERHLVSSITSPGTSYRHRDCAVYFSQPARNTATSVYLLPRSMIPSEKRLCSRGTVQRCWCMTAFIKLHFSLLLRAVIALK